MKWYPVKERKQPLMSVGHAIKHGAVFGNEVASLTDGCKLVPVKKAGTSLPLKCQYVGLHYSSYNCRLAQEESMVEIDFTIPRGVIIMNHEPTPEEFGEAMYRFVLERTK